MSETLNENATITLDVSHRLFHKITHVLRGQVGDELILFNEDDGAWRAALTAISKKELVMRVMTLQQPPHKQSPLLLLCAPPKMRARWHHLIEQAVQGGVTIIQPVRTQHGGRASFNHEAACEVALAATEQCGLLSCPAIQPIRPFEEALHYWADEKNAQLFFCHPSEKDDDAPHLWDEVQGAQQELRGVMIGSEGGWSKAECQTAAAHPSVRRVHLGQNFYRVDSAAFLALSLMRLAESNHHAR